MEKINNLERSIELLGIALEERDEEIISLKNQMSVKLNAQMSIFQEKMDSSIGQVLKAINEQNEVQRRINEHREMQSIMQVNTIKNVQIQNLMLKEGMEITLYNGRPKPLCRGIRESFWKIFYPSYYKEQVKKYYNDHSLQPLGGGMILGPEKMRPQTFYTPPKYKLQKSSEIEEEEESVSRSINLIEVEKGIERV